MLNEQPLPDSTVWWATVPRRRNSTTFVDQTALCGVFVRVEAIHPI
jgi:hypothetical protein